MTIAVKVKIRNRPKAADVAAKVGRSVRTVKRWAAIPRAQWLAEQAARRAEAARLRLEEGLDWDEIAQRIGAPSRNAARMLAIRARRERGDYTTLLRVTPQEKRLIEAERAKQPEAHRG